MYPGQSGSSKNVPAGSEVYCPADFHGRSSCDESCVWIGQRGQNGLLVLFFEDDPWNLYPGFRRYIHLPPIMSTLLTYNIHFKSNQIPLPTRHARTSRRISFLLPVVAGSHSRGSIDNVAAAHWFFHFECFRCYLILRLPFSLAKSHCGMATD